jgi:3-hydroxyisobutyrate dehydrogenase-like beta-hydroxyacid dehydrogenase
MRVGFIGLGDQGGPMARRIVDAGHPTTLWARRGQTITPFADSAASIAETPRALGEQSDLVCICVVNDTDVGEVLEGEQGVLQGLASGSVVAVHSTVHPDTVVELARRWPRIRFVDAPVSGGGDAAAAGALLVMVGGAADDVERCRPVFATYGDPVVHVGGLGAGQTAKLVNNLVFASHLATASAAFMLGDALALDGSSLATVLAHGSARSYALDLTAAMGRTAAAIGPVAGPLLRKDVGLVADLAQRHGLDPGVLFLAADAALDLLAHPRPIEQG